ncbi:LuxR C-terminal-related transcriptional regulator [Actinocorallia longicatena]|uniref:LuxR C-terminal-related transcriptional regulator n=1 Tax=Actinocorallia longicatena TaxID=111803 RepID=A0ABP6QHQ6_9ACTN
MAGWPFAGRAAELTRLGQIARESALVIAGPAGAGKSRLAAEIVEGFPQGEFTVARVSATGSANGIPYGALAHLLPAESPGGMTNPLRWAAEAISVRGRRLLLAVDDAHLLDAASAATVRYLVANAGAYLVATVRTGEHVPDAVASLWKDGFAVRSEIGPLTAEDTALMLHARLGGPVDDTTLQRLYRATEGNALLVRELVGAALDSGELAEERGMWRLAGVPAPGPRLTELIQERIGKLSGVQAAVLEYVALAEPLGLRPLTALCGAAAVEEAEARGLVRVEAAGRRAEVRLAHPLYGEVARAQCPSLRRRSRFAALARTHERYGAHRREDPLRLTLWRIESGLGAPPGPLLKACRLAWAAHDYPLALRLGHLAVTAGGGLEASLLLATVLDNAQLPDEARAVLDALPTPVEPAQRVQVTLAKASNLAWGMNRLGGALALLSAEVPELAVRRLSLLASATRPAEALNLADALLDAGGLEAGQVAQVLNARALALVQLGRIGEGVAVLRTALADGSWRDGVPVLVSPLHSTWAMAGLFSGDLRMTREAVASMSAAEADQHGWSRGEGSLALWRGQLAMAEGRPRTALSVLHAAAHHPTATTVGGCMGAYAAALAMRGDAAGARAALTEARRRNRPTWTAFTRWAELTDIAIATASGQTSEAAHLAAEAAASARLDGLPGFELLALHDLVRLNAAGSSTVVRLSELRFLGIRAETTYRQARWARDPEGLTEVAREWAAQGFTLFAAETAARAAAVLRRDGTERRRRNAETLALEYLTACEDADTLPLHSLGAPDLTPRLWEVVHLVVSGLSNREIGERLHLSKRTIDNHLRTIYMRTGIPERSQLGRLLLLRRR